MISRILAAAAIVVMAMTLTSSASGQPGPRQITAQEFAQTLLAQTQDGRFLSSQGLLELQMLASGTNQLGGAPQGADTSAQKATVQKQATAPLLAPCCGPNTLVNNPAEDKYRQDQTTQSETTIAVVHRPGVNNIVVGFNDSQNTLDRTTAATNLTGYAVSKNGGKTFTDMGTLPNPAQDGYRAGNNFGDPSLATDAAGNVYFATLASDPDSNSGGVAVAKSTDGGLTFSRPVYVSPSNKNGYFGDKERVTTGKDPATGKTNLYVAWDDFTYNNPACQNGAITGLPVARSTDGGLTYHMTYLDTFCNVWFVPAGAPGSNCSQQQYIGADPVVDSHGVLYVAAWRVKHLDPLCTFTTPWNYTLELFKSTDGGQTWGPPVTIGTNNPVYSWFLAPGQLMRSPNFPDMAINGSTINVVWNDRDTTDPFSHILMATSTDGGATFSAPSQVTTGFSVELQPAIALDASGVHVAYYQIHFQLTGNTFDVMESTSRNQGASWTVKRITNVSSPGVQTIPNFDPIIAWGYMGDYIADVSDGTHRYIAWGDNRNVVSNFLYPAGRHDPDVYFAQE